jgi:hypothetical protein
MCPRRTSRDGGGLRGSSATRDSLDHIAAADRIRVKDQRNAQHSTSNKACFEQSVGIETSKSDGL